MTWNTFQRFNQPGSINVLRSFKQGVPAKSTFWPCLVWRLLNFKRITPEKAKLNTNSLSTRPVLYAHAATKGFYSSQTKNGFNLISINGPRRPSPICGSAALENVEKMRHAVRRGRRYWISEFSSLTENIIRVKYQVWAAMTRRSQASISSLGALQSSNFSFQTTSSTIFERI